MPWSSRIRHDCLIRSTPLPFRLSWNGGNSLVCDNKMIRLLLLSSLLLLLKLCVWTMDLAIRESSTAGEMGIDYRYEEQYEKRFRVESQLDFVFPISVA